MELLNSVEQQLKEAGEQLSLPPSSTKDLLQLLDKTEQLLSYVGQAPPISMQGALVPSMGALIGDELIKHSDLDVRVAVASCLSEVARITAPESPYKDEIMKEIFRLNMVAYGELANLTGQSYYKSIHILESFAKVKVCLLMLDLKCDDLVLEMFTQFLRNIRPSHPNTVFTAMATIMTLVIEESDGIPTELLSLLISHVRKEKQDISPVPYKLAEKVLSNCKDTLKSYAWAIKKLIKSDPNDYAEVVTVLCKNAIENELVISKSTNRDINTLGNGGSIKTLTHSQSKQQKYIVGERIAAVSNKINQHQLKGTSQNLNGSHSAKGRPKKNKNNVNQHNKPKLVQDSQSSKKKSSKKPVANGSHGKDNPKIYGQDLVGQRIKVWWPLDKMYYEGAVSSYNPTDNKHMVLYADGQDEVLDLSQERWRMLDDTSRDQQQAQIAVLQSPVTAPVKNLKQKEKRKLDSASTQENNSNPPKRRSSAYSLRTIPTREHEIKDANTSTTDILSNSEYHKDDLVQTPVLSRGINSSEKIIEVERDGEPNAGENLEQNPRLLDLFHTIEMEQNGEPNPSVELEETRMPESSEIEQVREELEEKKLPESSEIVLEKDCELNQRIKPEEKKLSESSEIIEAEQACEQNPSVEQEEKREPESSDMIERIPSGELEVKRMAETNETIQCLDKSDGLVSESQSDQIIS